MKKLLIVFCGLSLMLWSCVNTPPKVENPPLLKQFLDEFLADNPNCIDNDIIRKDCGEKLKTEFLAILGDSIPHITELPVQYLMSLKESDSTYLLKFSCGKHTSGLNLSDNYDASFEIFTRTDKETAAMLKDKELYYISGSCYNYADSQTFPLPSGKKHSHYPYVGRSTFITKPEIPNFNLGTLVVDNLSFTPAQ